MIAITGRATLTHGKVLLMPFAFSSRLIILVLQTISLVFKTPSLVYVKCQVAFLNDEATNPSPQNVGSKEGCKANQFNF